jgi:1,4-dihydroxy-2-naphthoate octaprenyltransferase
MRYYKIILWSNIPMALEAVAWMCLTFKTLNLQADFVLIFIAFAFTWLFYTRDRLDISTADLVNNPERSMWYAQQPYLKTLSLRLSALVLIALCFRLRLITPVLLGIIPCLLYTTQLKIGHYSFTLKALWGMKVVLVAFLWVLLTVLFPVYALNLSVFSKTVPHLAMMIGCFIMLQIHTNDLRDIEGDSEAHIKSFAVLLGDKWARVFGLFLIVLGTYWGLSLFNAYNLLGFSTILAVRTLFYSKEKDIYWQILVTMQGSLAYFIL